MTSNDSASCSPAVFDLSRDRAGRLGRVVRAGTAGTHRSGRDGNVVALTRSRGQRVGRLVVQRQGR
jgi:hypothetical protein